jgi:hypothetical protein
MAKETGLGWTTLTMDNDAGAGKDIKNDVTEFDFSMPYGTQETTGVDKYAKERLALLADFSGSVKTVFNPAADRSHVVLGGNLRVVRTLALAVSTKTLSNEVLLTDYAGTRAASGEFTFNSPFVLADGTVPTWG